MPNAERIVDALSVMPHIVYVVDGLGFQSIFVVSKLRYFSLFEVLAGFGLRRA